MFTSSPESDLELFTFCRQSKIRYKLTATCYFFHYTAHKHNLQVLCEMLPEILPGHHCFVSQLLKTVDVIQAEIFSRASGRTIVNVRHQVKDTSPQIQIQKYILN